VPELVARAVETGLWVPERALSVGRLIPEPGNAAAYWGMLLSTESLSFEQCQLVERKGLAATQAIDDDWLRGCTLAKLAPHLTSTSLHEAVAIAETIGNEQHRTEALAALQLNLADTPELQSQRGPDPVQGSQDKKTPEWVVLCQGSPVKDEGQEAVLREEFQTALAHKDRESRVEALAALAPRLMGELLQKGLAAANAIDDQWICAYPIAALTSQLADVTQEPVLHAGLAMALAIHDDDARWIALKTLAPLLKGTLLKHGLAAALAIEDYEGYRARVLAAMVPQLVGEEREQVLREGLASAQATQDEQRGDALATLAPYLTGELLQQGLALANTIANDLSRAEALAALASQLTGATREAVLHEVITGVLASEDWEFQARALVALAPQLAAEDCEVMLRVTLEINDGCCRADALTALAPRLAGGLLQKGLAAALAIDDEESRIRALAALIPQLMDGDREEALRAGLAATQLISKDYIRADALAALAPHLIDELLQEGLAATQVIEGDWSRAHALAALAPHLTDELLQEGLAATQVIEGDWSRAHALAAFLPVISNSEALIRSIRQAVADYLWTASEGLERELIAQFCADRDLFTPPILSPDTLAAIAGHIIEICQEWEWL